ncbi:U32 family peptidase [Allorhodopirellula solitaria]|uniref:Putative protease YhbU n=1 Tax=Allorhodopirellula solitaria TaxID=2527987 RepID=A0A5C5XRI7_9BACT|nr:U32 family peptidase [Allorhodopirellula solitaria]TWT65121.1 putative protease YhbU precursor [Allorhodopirellula solitaria]
MDHTHPYQPAPERPELLSPAGSWDCADAAVENGADAIYFGVDRGFNARSRAANFGVGDLPGLMKMLRRRGVRGYVTLNTLVFPAEMPSLVEVVAAVAEAGVDAVLVQDFGVARIVRAICPELEVHASTQMSLTSAETIAVAAELGLARVVLARELSIAEITKIRSKTAMPLEAFIHGALCVAYSGQCLTSESLGGRSANRGQCAQACRLPYELVCDGQDQDLGDVRYLLSPQDLAGYAAIPDMISAGVDSLKIEGRLKTPEYVANITGHYRRAIDQAVADGSVRLTDRDRQEMELSFSRGFAPGWLEGNDHKRLVPGLRAAKQGILLGQVMDVRGDEIRVTLAADVALGDGLAIASRPAPSPSDAYAGSGFADNHQGGRIYSLQENHRSTATSTDRTSSPNRRKDPAALRRRPSSEKMQTAKAGSDVWIGFARDSIDFLRIEPAADVFKNDDPKLNKKLAATFGGKPRRTRGIDFRVEAHCGNPLCVTGVIDDQTRPPAMSCQFTSQTPLESARKHAITSEVLADKLGRLGGTPFHLGRIDAAIEDAPMVPLAMINAARREIIDGLTSELEQVPARSVDAAAGMAFTDGLRDPAGPENAPAPKLSVLCRTVDQLAAAAEMGVETVIADFHDVRTHRDAVRIGRAAGVPTWIATIRMQKPSEMGLIRQVLKYQPDGVLARNLAAVDAAVAAGVPTVADFSLNIANHRSAEWLIGRGVERVTASYDLNADQLDGLISTTPGQWIEMVMHQHMPMFHMEHCVFCSVLSPGTNKTNCGRPCDRHVVQLRDRVGKMHVLQADIACRNTLYNATPQSAADVVSSLVDRGVGWFRVELLDESAAEAEKILSLYRRLLSGQISGTEVWQSLAADNRVGVTRGTLEAKRNPLAIL